MELAAVLALLQAAPAAFAAASQIRASLSETDIAVLDAAIDTAKIACLSHIGQAISDLNAAAKE